MQMVLVVGGRMKRYFDLLMKNMFLASSSLLRRKTNAVYVPGLIGTSSLLKIILILSQNSLPYTEPR